MKKRAFLLLSALFAVTCFLSGCSSADTEVFIVASQTRQCSGVGKQRCMLVKNVESEPWQFFYGGIDGFDYEPGYQYVVKVKKEKIENPPQDASDIKYSLMEVMSKEYIESTGLPPDVAMQEDLDL